MRPLILPIALALLALPLAAADAALKPGTRVADFTTDGALAGKRFRLRLDDALRKGPVVLYFFPAANTPGCNVEARAFADAVEEFRKAGATVIGMSADPVDKLQAFSVEHCSGKFPVASASPKLIAAFDVAMPGRDGKVTGRTDRTSYVITPDRRIYYSYSDRSPADHVANTLAAVQRYQAKRRR